MDEVSALLVDARLIATENGQIATIFPKRGELVAPGTPIMNLVVVDDIHVVLNVREDLMPQFKMDETFVADVPAIGKKNIENRCAVVSVQTLHMDMAQAAFELDSTYGIMTRVGLHCAPNAHKTLGTYPEGTLRFSFGPENTKQELDIALDALSALL